MAGDFCTGDTTDSLTAWRCATFITFIVSYVLLACFGLWLFIYHRWQANLEKRLLIEDYQFHQQQNQRKSNRNSSKQGTMKEGLINTIDNNYNETVMRKY